MYLGLEVRWTVKDVVVRSAGSPDEKITAISLLLPIPLLDLISREEAKRLKSIAASASTGIQPGKIYFKLDYSMKILVSYSDTAAHSVVLLSIIRGPWHAVCFSKLLSFGSRICYGSHLDYKDSILR